MKNLKIVYRAGRYGKFQPLTITVPETLKATPENLLIEAKKADQNATEAKLDDRA